MTSTMLRAPGRHPNRIIAGTAFAFAAVATFAQSVPAVPASTAAKSAVYEEAVLLNPFEVSADPDRSYGAMNANSITTFNVALDRIPVTADIMTEAFMKEVGAMTVEGMLTAYDAGATFGGAGSAQPVVNQPGDHGSNPGVGLRGSKKGLAPQTDGIQLNAGNYGSTNFGSTSTFDLERIEVLNGPQALLYQGAGAGGVINQVQKQARFGRPTFYELSFRADQYGTKYATLDYGASKGRFAVRIAAVDGSIQTRRVNLAERLKALYGQFAVRLWNTTFSLTLRQSVSTKTYQHYVNLSSTGDPNFSKYNSYDLKYLLATNQADTILNGKLTWDNVGSFAGYQFTDFAVGEHAVIKAESVWSRWLSTQLIAGAANYNILQAGYNSTLNLYSPAATANPLPGNWTMSFPASGNPMQAAWRPHVSKALRFVAVASHEFLGGRAKSKTSLDIDTTSTLASLPAQNYFKTDDDWNIVFGPPFNVKNGRTQVPAMSWTVNNGPVLYTLVNPGVDRFVWNGVKYRMQANNIGPQGRSYYFQKGFALVNYTQWLEGKFDTMLGARSNVTNGIGGSPFHKPEYSFGLVWHPLPWLAPYYQLSDLWMTGNDQQPDGTYGPSNHNVNHELGVKLNPASGKISGSLSLYRKADTSESFNAPGIASVVSPDGLNGNLPDGTGGNLAANALTYGATAALTASPTKNWRMRLSAAWTGGTFKQRVSFGQLYNDQFYQNSAGQVTYADKTVVYVPATFNAKQLTVPATTPGAVPLTIAMLSTPGSQYYAQPQPTTGAILKTSNGGLALLSPADPVHGPILTGATGLPISAYQLNPALSGVAPVGTVLGAEPGGPTFGFPQYSVNFTNVYEFSEGWLNGFKLGGTVSANWKYVVSYYYNSIAQATPANLQKFSYPSTAKFDLITGYSHRFRRFTWSSQVNVNNLFNTYRVVLFPNVNSGFATATAIRANFYGQPRYYSWTNSIKF